jgi:DNA replication protein DnaC
MRSDNWYPDIPERYRKWEFDDFSEAVRAEANKFFIPDKTHYDNIRHEPMTIYLHGNVGTKKTSLACAILRRWRRAGLPSQCGGGYGEFVDADRFAAAVRNLEDGRHMILSWRNAHVLLLDDLGAARSTPAVVEQLCFLVSYRYNHCLPTIATANLSLPELATALDARIASRFQEGIVLDLGTVDARAVAK